MDIYLFYLLILIILLLILVGIVYLSYWIPKKMGKRKLGIILSRILSIGLILLVLSFIFEDELYSKSDAKESLVEHKIELKDNFKILTNQSGGIRDYYHSFELEISETDKNRLINQIKASENFKDKIQEDFYLPENRDRYSGESITVNYESKWDYKTEYYKPNGTGVAPTYHIISISKTKNILKYENIID